MLLRFFIHVLEAIEHILGEFWLLKLENRTLRTFGAKSEKNRHLFFSNGCPASKLLRGA
jgi:hypothetical protein